MSRTCPSTGRRPGSASRRPGGRTGPVGRRGCAAGARDARRAAWSARPISPPSPSDRQLLRPGRAPRSARATDGETAESANRAPAARAQDEPARRTASASSCRVVDRARRRRARPAVLRQRRRAAPAAGPGPPGRPAPPRAGRPGHHPGWYARTEDRGETGSADNSEAEIEAGMALSESFAGVHRHLEERLPGRPSARPATATCACAERRSGRRSSAQELPLDVPDVVPGRMVGPIATTSGSAVAARDGERHRSSSYRVGGGAGRQPHVDGGPGRGEDPARVAPVDPALCGGTGVQARRAGRWRGPGAARRRAVHGVASAQACRRPAPGRRPRRRTGCERGSAGVMPAEVHGVCEVARRSVWTSSTAEAATGARLDCPRVSTRQLSHAAPGRARHRRQPRDRCGLCAGAGRAR